VFVVREIDRLSRNLAKQLAVEAELKRHNVEIDYVLGDYPDTPEGRLNKHIRASIAEFEREQINVRMTRGRRLKVKSGSVLVSKRPPYGYRVIEKDRKWSLEIDEREADVVRLVFVWYTRGDGDHGPLNMADICHKLSAMGVPSPADTNWFKNLNAKKRKYGEWSKATVRRILTNESYIGTWHFGKRNGRKNTTNDPDNRITVAVPTIVDMDTWKVAQERLEYNRRNGMRPLKYQYLMRRRLKCGMCQGAMAGCPQTSRGKIHLYYSCMATRNKLSYARECDARRFRAEIIDSILLLFKNHIYREDYAATV
jgi:site-specific DNA recombinase